MMTSAGHTDELAELLLLPALPVWHSEMMSPGTNALLMIFDQRFCR